MAFLLVTVGDEVGAKHELVGDETLIGRHPDCDVVVEAGAVSRYHARIRRRGEEHWLEDAQSRNGTFLNGQLVTESQLLREGDHVRVCDTELTYHAGAQPEFVAPNTVRFEGTNFGVMMVDDGEPSTRPNPRVEVRRGSSGAIQLAASTETKLAALLQIVHDLGRALALDEVLPKVLESLFKIFPQADRGFIVLEEPGGALVPKWIKTRRVEDEGETVRISRTIIREAMTSKEVLLSLDAANDARFEMSDSIADFRIRSMICAPLLDTEGRALGALQIDTVDQRNRFGGDEVDVLTAVAAQAGIAIHNAQLHEQALLQKAVEQDLKLAVEVQRAFLPAGPPEVPGYAFHSYYRAARDIGGDYFDYVRLPDGRIGVVVADVVGHGVAAAMFMAKLSAETRFCLASEGDPARAVERLNDRLSEVQVEQFVTFLLAVLDPQTHTLAIVNAGHMPPIVRAADGKISEPGGAESGIPVGIVSGTPYEAVTVRLAPGELVVLYTDGVNEAMDASGELYGVARVRGHVERTGDAEGLARELIADVQQFTGPGNQEDDVCVVVIGRDRES